jgi:hypothetical protein
MRWLPIFPNEESKRPVMERLYLLETRLVGLYLHRFPASRHRPIIGAHDHPWSFVTVVLRGGYDEIRCVGAGKPRRRWSVSFRGHKTVHKIRVFPEGALTLCIRGPKRQDWSWRRLP